jgi:hypothetical protein
MDQRNAGPASIRDPTRFHGAPRRRGKTRALSPYLSRHASFSPSHLTSHLLPHLASHPYMLTPLASQRSSLPLRSPLTAHLSPLTESLTLPHRRSAHIAQCCPGRHSRHVIGAPGRSTPTTVARMSRRRSTTCCCRPAAIVPRAAYPMRTDRCCARRQNGLLIIFSARHSRYQCAVTTKKMQPSPVPPQRR